jgi:hypothetical protein
MPAVSEGSRGGLRRDHGRSRDVTLSGRCRDVTRGHDPGSGRHRPPGSRASVRDRIRGGARASVLWRSAAARSSATATRQDAPCPEPLQRSRDTTQPRDIAGSRGTGTQGRSSAFRIQPCPPWSGSRPPAGVNEGPKWREQSQFAGRSKSLYAVRLSDDLAQLRARTKPISRGRGPRGCGRRSGIAGGARARSCGVMSRRGTPPQPRGRYAPWPGAIATRPGHHPTTGHHRISGDGDSGPVLSSQCLPCLPWSGSRPPAGVKEGRNGARYCASSRIISPSHGGTSVRIWAGVPTALGRNIVQSGEAAWPAVNPRRSGTGWRQA